MAKCFDRRKGKKEKMSHLNIKPADDLAARVVEHFKGKIGATDFGFVYRLYDTPPKQNQDQFTQGEIHGYRALIPFYPASVVKFFFMVALLECVKKKTITLDREDKRALENMIRISSNDATTYLLNRMTGTTGGPALSNAEMEIWWQKRSRVHRYFDGYHWPEFESIKLFHSTYEECPYGREQMARDLYGTNLLTPLASASLMHAVAAGQIIDAGYSEQMMGLLSRDWERDPKYLETSDSDQVRGFISQAVPQHLKVWSKAGLTSVSRNDLVYIESPKGQALTIAVFSQGKACAENKQFLPVLGQYLMELIPHE